MKIIDNKKDYYDYLSGVYGIDDLIVYDRRGSISSKDIVTMWPEFFNPAICCYDAPSSGYVNPQSEKYKHYSFAELTMIIEIGTKHYYIIVKRIRDKADDPVKITYTGFSEDDYIKYKKTILGRVYSFHSVDKINRKLSSAPLAIIFKLPSNNACRAGAPNGVYDNPILKDIPGISKNISPEIVWQGLYDYISSSKDKKISDNRTNDEHILSAGFDLKTSFRKM